MRKSRMSLCGSLAVVATACLVGALAAAPPKGAAGKVGTNPVIRGHQIVGLAVKNSQDKDLGKVEDIVVDMSTGQVRYVAIAFGGFLGVGDKLFAVPFQALKVVHDPGKDKTHFLLNVDKKTLENAKGFDKSDWPDFANPRFAEENDRHFVNPATASRKP